MSGVNKVMIIGRLGKDPEVRHLESGKVVSNFSLATSEKYTNKSTGEITENTEWHNVSLWGAIAEVAEKYLKKGDLVYIEGKLKTKSWEKDGVTRYMTEVLGNQLQMLSPKGSNNGAQQQATSQPIVASTRSGDIALEDQSDDLPW